MPNTVEETLKSRISTRAYLQKPVTKETIQELLDIAKWSPSGGNLQRWQVHIVMGQARDRLVDTVKKRIAENPFADEAELAVYPKSLQEPYRTRRYQMGEGMYEILGIPREDKATRLLNLAKNFELFGAPVAIFFSIDRMFDKGQWAHLGMFMQSLALAAQEKGLATCMQEAWITRAKTVSKFLDLPENMQLYCGMTLGYADPEAPVNALRSSRAPIDEFATFIDQ